MPDCKKCNDKGWNKIYIGHSGRLAKFVCDCHIGVQLQSDYDKADEKYHAQTMDVEEGTAQ